jgi:hypothetical protein
MKVLILGYLLYQQTHRYQEPGPSEKMPPPSVVSLAGMWDVETFTRDGATLPPLLTDRSRWQKVVIGDEWGAFAFDSFGVNGKILGGWTVGGDSTESQFVLIPGEKALKRVTLAVTRTGSERLRLSGTINGHALTVEIRRADKDDMRLLSRGFYWVSEFPFNR